MYDDLALKLPIEEINRQLTRNARERHRLQTLLRLTVEAQEDADRVAVASPHAPQPEAARPEEATRA